MKTINQGKIKLATLLSLVLTGIAGHASAVEKVDGLELLDNVGKYTQPMHVFYAATPSTTELENILALSETLGRETGVVFDRDTLPSIETRIGLGSQTDLSASFEVDTVTGNFLFNSGMTDYRKESSTPGLPSKDEAVSLSTKVLEKLNLAVKTDEMKLEHVGGLNMAVTEGKGDSTIFEKLRTVRYSRVLDNLTVEGDSRIIVHFGQNSETAGLIFQWPKISDKRQLDSGDLLTSDAIREQALKQIETVVSKALNATLTGVDLVLYDDGKGVMEPAYHIVLERHFDYGQREPTMIPYDFYVPITLKPAAFYPYMDVASKQPSDGADTSKIDNGPDE